MFVYSRRSGPIELRPAWVIGPRLVTFAVTVAVAWPSLGVSATLRQALTVYAFITLGALLAWLLGRRLQFHLVSTVALVTQFAAEIVVISMIVYYSGGMESPSNSLYLMTIMSAALSHRLAGTLIAAGTAGCAFITAAWMERGHQVAVLWSPDWFAALGQLSDADFYTVFLRLCVFFLCAFAGGYLAQRLHSKDQALAHTSEALKLAKLETGDILKHLRSGVLTVDLGGHIVYFNRAAEEILGLQERKVRGLLLVDVFNPHFPELTDRLQWVLASQQMDHRTQLTIHRPDGRTIPVGLSTSLLTGTQGKPRGVIAVFADLTEAKLLEDKVRTQDRLAAIGELSAGIAHEIRNPLAAISGSVEVLRNDLPVTGENRKLLDLIVTESARLNKILGDFLLYARLSPTVTGRVRVATVLDEVMEIVRRHFAHGDTLVPDLRTDVNDRTLSVEADNDHLKQILINLIFNAVEACPKGSGRIIVRVRIEPVYPAPDRGESPPHAEEWVSIAVVDNGRGIPPQVQERLYEPFVSSKPNGTGLGLAIVKRIVDNANGRITAETTPGEGTTFTVHLRRCPTVVGESVRAAVPA